MKAEERVTELSEELKKVDAEIRNVNNAYESVEQRMEKAYDDGDYTWDEVKGWFDDKQFLSIKQTKLTKQREKLVKKLTKIIASHKLEVDDETASLLD